MTLGMYLYKRRDDTVYTVPSRLLINGSKKLYFDLKREDNIDVFFSVVSDS